jgi:hypothetical protein
MKIGYQYDKQKVLQALRYHFINKQDIRILIIAVNVLAAVAGILFFMQKILPYVFLATSVLWIVLMIVFWFLLPRLIYSRERTFKDNFITEINDVGVGLQSDSGTRFWNYDSFKSWFESPHFFHLYVGPNSFFLIPKDNFETAQLGQARTYFRQHIGEKTKK